MYSGNKHSSIQSLKDSEVPLALTIFADWVMAAVCAAYHVTGSVVLSIDIDIEVLATPVLIKKYGDNVPFPHLLTGVQGFNYQYRVSFFSNICYKRSYLSNRRLGIGGLHGMKQAFLKEFYTYHMKALEQLETKEPIFLE